ncbi:MAG: hypothetical protein PHE74_06935, partial [Comamonas sp.]|nr:hypothetical protein [Comamonas sp.]
VQAILPPVAAVPRWKSSSSMLSSKTDRFSSGVAPYIPAQVRRLCLGVVPACAIGRGFTAQRIKKSDPHCGSLCLAFQT